MSKVYRLVRMLILCMLVLGSANGPLQGGIAIQVNNANVNLETQTLSLYGINFDAFGPASVTIGDVLLSQCTLTATLIDCSLASTPVITTGGNWKVSVSAGNAPHANASIDIYIPAQFVQQQCFAGDVLECYSGDPATRGVSQCHPGIRTCLSDGTWSACQGEVIPQPQNCATNTDEDCDGLMKFADPDCAGFCTTPNMICGTECVDINTDSNNCGACGSQCGVDHVCSGGACALSCTLPKVACAGQCIDTNTDPQNCGACGQACAVGQSCVAGSCL